MAWSVHEHKRVHQFITCPPNASRYDVAERRLKQPTALLLMRRTCNLYNVAFIRSMILFCHTVEDGSAALASKFDSCFGEALTATTDCSA
jgi:hypothetical protein